MERKEFDSLLIHEQVKYLNDEIKKGISVSKVCKEIGIAKSTVLTRLKKHDYVANKEGVYILSKDYKANEVASNRSKSKSKVKKASEPSELDLLIKRVESIEKQIKQLKIDSEAVKTHKAQEFIPTEFNSDIKQITARLNVEVYDKLNKMYKEHKLVSKQVILNSLLNEILDKYLR